MLDCLPIYHWFHCGNPYSGAQGGMRYLVAPAKKADPAEDRISDRHHLARPMELGTHRR